MSILKQFEIEVNGNETKVTFSFKDVSAEYEEMIKILEKTNNQLQKALINPKPSKFKQLTLWQK